MNNPKSLSETVDMINFICNLATTEEYTEEEIEYYESLYKVMVLECIDDILEQLDFEDEDEYQDMYDSYAMQYNPDNLVHYFKYIQNEKE